MLATVVDVGALLQVIGVSLAAGAGLTLAFSLAIASAAKAIHQRRIGGDAAAAGWWALTGALGLLIAVAVILGVLTMLSK